MGLLHALPLVLFAQCVLSSTTLVHESISHAPSGFKASGSPSPTQEIKLFIALVQSNITGLAKVVDAVSNPSGPSYGKYLTAAEVAEYVKPPPASVSTVTDWVTPNVASVKPFSPAGDILQVSLTVAQAEGLFNTKFSTYTRSADGQSVIRALNYSLPSTVQQHILHVHPIIAFTPPPQHTSKNTVCIQEFYGLPNNTVSGSLTNTIGVQGYNSPDLGEYANNDDLATFLNEFRPDIAGNTFNITLLNGAQNLQDNSGGLEGQLDIQYTVGIAGDVPTTYLLDGSKHRRGDFIHVQDTINWLLTQEEPPTVFTTSYGNLETDLTPTAATSVCNGYMQLAAIGISMIFASGDGGAANNDQEDCTSFVPTFPPTCPYVTSVGGTFFQPPTAFSSSSGGFSNLFPETNTAGFYNPTGRGFPDVASEWEIFIVNAGGVSALQSGTSCASPIFASFIATGRGGLDDVTVAAGRQTNGWDPVTGLGTPDFPGMLEALGI
ncbi:family S53 protease [Mycena olivaceomarginata]|nr:family S53 protease [Mycena olivaceomarginata]